jgi:hypothetical protein
MSVKIPADVLAAMTEIARQFGRHGGKTAAKNMTAEEIGASEEGGSRVDGKADRATPRAGTCSQSGQARVSRGCPKGGHSHTANCTGPWQRVFCTVTVGVDDVEVDDSTTGLMWIGQIGS